MKAVFDARTLGGTALRGKLESNSQSITFVCQMDFTTSPHSRRLTVCSNGLSPSNKLLEFLSSSTRSKGADFLISHDLL